MKEMIERWSLEGEDYPSWLADVVEFRALNAALFGVKANEIGVVANASAGLAALAESIGFEKRKKVVTSGLNFPSNVVLWHRMKETGLLDEVELVEPEGGRMPLERWERAVDEDTAVVAVDYVSWVNGYREDVRAVSELAHRRGAIVVVDAYHGAGVFPIDLKKDGVDAAVWGMSKWLCGPHGVACLYLREELLERLQPRYMGWLGVDDNTMERVGRKEDPFARPMGMGHGRPAKSAARYEWGTHASILIKGALGAMKMAVRYDPAYRFRVITRRKLELLDGLKGLGARVATPTQESGGSGIVAFEQRDQTETVAALAAKSVVVSGRFGNLRVSPHYYNTAEDMATFLTALKEVRSGQRSSA
jgi:selenocysteine lyase/cysteine desulfurase